jgi:hypothetical protein
MDGGKHKPRENVCVRESLWNTPSGDLGRKMKTHRGKPGHQALQRSSFPEIAFSNRAEEMAQ